MKKIFLGLLVGALALGGAHAQDAATQQQIDKLSGQLQDIIDTEAAQGKQLDNMAHDLAELRDKVNAPAVNNYASNDDLQKLAAQLQEMDKRHQADRELILSKIEDLAKLSVEQPHPIYLPPPPRRVVDDTPAPEAPADVPHYEYIVKAGDSLTAIIKAYNEKGVKVTLRQVLKANPSLDPKKLYVGKKIIIPMTDKTTK